MSRLLPALLLLCASLPAPAIDFTVDTTTSAVDANPGDGQCRTAAGQCSLRAAVLEANALPGADLIRFNIAPGGVQQINLAHTDAGGNTAALTITEALTIDGSTQPGFNGHPLIGVHCQNAFSAFIVAAPQVQIRHLAFTGFPQNALRLDGNGTLVRNAWFGSKPDGTTLQANGVGVQVNGSGNRIEDSRFHRNSQGGVVMGPLSSGTAVLDSFFAFGGYPAGNGCIAGSAPLIRVSGSGQQIGPGNTIGGSSGDAVLFENASSSRFVGNYVGTTAVNTATCLVGGSVAMVGGGALTVSDNVIAGLGGHGLRVDGVAGILIGGNRIGLRADGSPFGNGGDGLRVEDSTDVIVGTGPDGAPAPNLVGANFGAGLYCLLSTITVAHNLVGTDALGSDLGNQGDGLYAGSCVGSSRNNLYWFNEHGVALVGAATLIDNRDNSYQDNAQLPVDIDRDGPTPGDIGDADLGPNRRQNTFEEGSVGDGFLELQITPSFALGNHEALVYATESCSLNFSAILYGDGRSQPIGKIPFSVAARGNTPLRFAPGADYPAYTVQVRDLASGATSELSRCFRRPGGWLGDRVWRDANRDGLQGESEPGIAGVRVELYDGAGVLVGTRITAADGRYRFANLASGVYRLRFELAPGHSHTVADVGSDDRIDSDVVAPSGSTASFTYTAGSVDATRDSGQYPEIHVGCFEGHSVQAPAP